MSSTQVGVRFALDPKEDRLLFLEGMREYASKVTPRQKKILGKAFDDEVHMKWRFRERAGAFCCFLGVATVVDGRTVALSVSMPNVAVSLEPYLGLPPVVSGVSHVLVGERCALPLVLVVSPSPSHHVKVSKRAKLQTSCLDFFFLHLIDETFTGVDQQHLVVVIA